MPLTEDQIIAEAERFAKEEIGHHGYLGADFTVAFARHYHRLKTEQATQPEQDPAFEKAKAVFEEAIDETYGLEGPAFDKAAARVIMSHYPSPPAEAVQWAKWIDRLANCDKGHRVTASYILKMAGEAK